MIKQIYEVPELNRFEWTVLKAATLMPSENQPEALRVLQISELQQGQWGGAVNFPPYGFALFRAGKYQEMLDIWDKQELKNPRIPAFRAMAHWHLGQQDQAQRILQETARAPKKIDLSKGWLGLFGWWDNHLSRQLFEREADQLILQHGRTAQRGEEARPEEESQPAVKALDAKAAK